jgi:hypothetical protein
VTDHREPLEPFEQQLADGLRALVDREAAPADLAARARLGATHLHRTHRRRRIVVVGSGAALAVGLLWLAGVVLADDDPREVRTVDAITTTTRATTTTSTTAPVVAPATTEVVTTTTAPATTTTADPPPEPGCAEATGDPRAPMTDWADYYQTEPGPDQPASIRMCVDDVTPKVGQAVTVTLVGDDPDAVILDEECGWLVLVPGGPLPLCRDYILGPPVEPQPTPTPEPGHIERSATVVFEAVGDQVVGGSVNSAEWTGRPHPYGSHVQVVIPVTVHG